MTEHRTIFDDVPEWAKDANGNVDLALLASMERDHSIFAPSSSAMWLACSGSLIPNILASDDAGEDAAWGTVAHACAEEWLRSGEKPTHLLNTITVIETELDIFFITVDDYMLDVVQEYVDLCQMLPGDHYVETRVDLSEYFPIPGQGGTADFAACVPGELTIVDFKGGRVAHVVAYRNSQLMLYALGFFNKYNKKYKFEKITIRIVQPRRDNFDTFVCTAEELIAFGEYVKKRARKAWKLDAPRTAGTKQCEWCRVKPSCAAYAQLMFDITAGAMDDVPRDEPMSADEAQNFKDVLATTVVPKLVSVHELSLDEMALLYSFRSAYDGWWKQLHERLLRAAFEGQRVPLFKVVEGKSKRVLNVKRSEWVRKLREIGFSDDEIFPKKSTTISPNQAEVMAVKLKGKKRKELPEVFDGMFKKPPGKPTLAPASDKRPEISDMSAFAFADLIETRETSEDEEL